MTKISTVAKIIKPMLTGINRKKIALKIKKPAAFLS
jgi:hypothetical protein